MKGYSGRFKKITKLGNGEYYIEHFSTGYKVFIILIEIVGLLCLFPFKLFLLPFQFMFSFFKKK